MAGSRMQENADKAGINKAMLHYYYRSKEKLFQKVFSKAFELLAPQMNKILNDNSSIEEKVRNFCKDYNSFMIKQPYLPNFIIQELNRNPRFFQKLQKNAGFPSLDKFKKQVAQEIEQGILKPIDAEQLFINIISLNLFPFVGKPLFKGLIKMDDKDYKELIKQRETVVAEFIINSIKK